MPRSDAVVLSVRRALTHFVADAYADDDLISAMFAVIAADVNEHAGRPPFEHAYDMRAFDTDWQVTVTGRPADD